MAGAVSFRHRVPPLRLRRRTRGGTYKQEQIYRGHKLCCRTGGIDDGSPQLMAPVPHEGEFISRDAEGIDAERVKMSEIDQGREDCAGDQADHGALT